MQYVRRKGRVVVVGAVPLEMQRSPFYEKEVDFVISCSYGPGRYDPEYEERGLDYPFAYVRWTENRNMSEYLRLIAERRVDFCSLVGSTHTGDEAPRAYADAADKQKVAILIAYPQNNGAAKPSAKTAATTDSRPATGIIRVGIVGPGSFVRAVHL